MEKGFNERKITKTMIELILDIVPCIAILNSKFTFYNI